MRSSFLIYCNTFLTIFLYLFCLQEIKMSFLQIRAEMMRFRNIHSECFFFQCCIRSRESKQFDISHADLFKSGFHCAGSVEGLTNQEQEERSEIGLFCDVISTYVRIQTCMRYKVAACVASQAQIVFAASVC